ncbi:PAS domain S-box protein [Candidatus Kaiserbacteria bacterium]|nr:PAS domain S-box protein [Candidatus Kaiserbacteria bacterium]
MLRVQELVLSRFKAIPTDTYAYLIIDAFVLTALYLIGLTNYLLSHSLAEMFSVVIMVIVFSITWHAREYLNNNYLLFIGISLVFVASFDLLHTLFYGGMGVTAGNMETNMTDQLWIAARYLQAGSLLAAPFFINKKLKANAVLFAYAAIASLVLLSIFYWDLFPTAYVSGAGQTSFMMASEFIVTALIILSLVSLAKKRASFGSAVFILLFMFAAVSAISELLFAMHAGEHGSLDIAGHLLKIIAFYLLYRAVVITSFEDPHALLQKNIDRRKNELELHATELEYLNQQLKKFQLALENTLDHVVITDPDGIVVYANKAAERITGYANRDILNKKVGVLWGKQMGGEFYQELWKTIKDKKEDFVGEFVNRRKNGQLYYSLATISPILDEKRNIQFFVGIERDITNRKKTERKLEEYARKMAEGKARDDALLLSIADGILVTDTSGEITFINKAVERICGIRAGEALGRDLYDAISFFDEHGKKASRDTGPIRVEGDASKREEMPITDSASFHVVNKKDGRRVSLSISAAPFVIGGGVLGTVVVLRDITYEKEIDKAKSEFISFASHQLRTPLTSISLSIDTLLHGLGDALTGEQKKYLKIAFNGIKDMTDIIETLLNISRIQMGTLVVSPEPTNLPKLSDEILQDISIAAKNKKMKIKRLYDKSLPAIKIDQRLMRIILENLVSNAMKYSSPNGAILVEIAKQGKDVLVAISDTGDGIPKEQQTRIFEKLFRVQVDGKVKGTGLGLYMVKVATDQYGGRVWCESPSSRAFGDAKSAAGGKGTTFFVTVPLAGMAAHNVAQPPAMKITPAEEDAPLSRH